MKLEDVLNNEDYIVHNIKGISMLPLLIQDEDLVLVEKVNDNLNLLDMVLFKRDDTDKYILHRILDIKKNYYLICGDNQNVMEKVYKKQIIGKVTGYYKKGRYVSINDDEYKEYVDNLQLDINKRNHLNGISNNIKDLLKLIVCTIKDTNIDQSSFNYEEIYKIAKRQNICAFIFNKIDNNNCPDDIYTKYQDEYHKNIQRTILFENETKNVFNSLNNNHIKYVPLKGYITNTLYKEYGTRYFNDIDVYVGYDTDINKVMFNMNYELKHNTLIELSFIKKPIYYYEMHQKLFSDDYKFSNYFNNLFDIAIKKDEYEYYLSNEDYYAYNIAHFYKHYKGGGVGIRFFIDLYYILNNIDVDKDKLDSILKKLELYDFNNEMINILNEILNNEYPIIELNKIFKGNTFGSRDTYIEQGIKKKGKFKYVLDRLFPSLDSLANSRPYLKKYPILLPLIWLYRIFNVSRWKYIFYEVKKVLNI